MEPDTQIGIKTVQYGELYRDAAGLDQMAAADMVLLTTILDGTPRHQLQLTPEQGMTVASLLARESGRLIADRVDDTGNRVGLTGYLRAMATKSHTTKEN